MSKGETGNCEVSDENSQRKMKSKIQGGDVTWEFVDRWFPELWRRT